MRRVLTNSDEFQNTVVKNYKALFRKLEKGQHPEAMFITCSDSRIDPCLITQTDPGDLFVMRNEGNVIPINEHDSSEAATIEYAVKQLKVKHIILCGHSNCGAIASILDSDENDLPNAANWLARNANAVREFSRRQTCAKNTLLLDKSAALVNIRVQLDNLRRYRFVREKIANGELELHGWFYDLETGQISVVRAGSRSMTMQIAATQPEARPEA